MLEQGVSRRPIWFYVLFSREGSEDQSGGGDPMKDAEPRLSLQPPLRPTSSSFLPTQ